MEGKMDHKTYHRSKTVTVFFLCVLTLFGLAGRLFYLMVFQSEYYSQKARELHERERSIKAARGSIIDANGKILADTEVVEWLQGTMLLEVDTMSVADVEAHVENVKSIVNEYKDIVAG